MSAVKQLTLKDLDEPGKFVVQKSVPVFCEHEDSETGKKIGRKELEELARVNNRRLLEEDTPGTIVIGHTPGRKEEDILTVGFKKNYHVRRFGKKQKLGLMVDCYYRPECYEKAKQYPHRSIELWTDDLIIEPLSLLARRPELDLGLLIPEDGPTQKKQLVNDGCELMVYHRGGQRRIYQMADEQPTAPASGGNLLKELCDGLEALITKVREKAGEATPEAPAPEGNPNVQTYGAMPSGTNTAMPELLTYSKEQYEAVSAERDSLKTKIETLQVRLDESDRLRQEEAKKHRKESRLQLFQKLKGEGVILEPETELTDTENLDEPAFEKHIAKVKKCYARSPKAGTGGFIPTDDQEERPNGNDDATEYERLRPRVVAYQKKHGVSFPQAFEDVKAGKT